MSGRRPRVVLVVALAVALSGGCARKRTEEPVTTPAAPHPRAQHAAEDEPPAEPSTPQLLPEAGDPERARIEESLARTDGLVKQVGMRELTAAQREQVEAVEEFARQSRQALGELELERAGILAEKARILIENVERDSR